MEGARCPTAQPSSAWVSWQKQVSGATAPGVETRQVVLNCFEVFGKESNIRFQVGLVAFCFLVFYIISIYMHFFKIQYLRCQFVAGLFSPPCQKGSITSCHCSLEST